MNSPKTSAQKPSAPVAALRAALPAGANERVNASLDLVAEAERRVDACEKALLEPCNPDVYRSHLDSFLLLPESGQDSMRQAVLDEPQTREAFAAIGAAGVPPATAERLRARLGAIVAEAAEGSVCASEKHMETIGSLFPGKDSILDLDEDDMKIIGSVQGLNLRGQPIGRMDPGLLKALIAEIPKLRALDLWDTHLAGDPSSLCNEFAQAVGKVPRLLLDVFLIPGSRDYPVCEAFLRDVKCLSIQDHGGSAVIDAIATARNLRILRGMSIYAPFSFFVPTPTLRSLSVRPASKVVMGNAPHSSEEVLARAEQLSVLSLVDLALGGSMRKDLRLLAPHLGHLRCLSLAGNDLYKYPRDDWAALIPELARVRALDLSRNGLDVLVSATWTTLATALLNVPSLDLRGNGLADIDPAVWAPLSSRPKGPDFQY